MLHTCTNVHSYIVNPYTLIYMYFVPHAEATIRFLKAKLRVMQEEMDRLCQECSEKVIEG